MRHQQAAFFFFVSRKYSASVLSIEKLYYEILVNYKEECFKTKAVHIGNFQMFHSS